MPLIRILVFALIAQSSLFGRVVRVVDGDTIKVQVGDRIETVRYIGVDTPETVHPNRPIEPYGKAASRFNGSLVQGKSVRLELDVEPRDRYGRLLAYVYVDTLFVNAELLRQGYAQLMTIPPNVRHVDDFVLLQREAREAGRGLWVAGSTLVDTSSVAAQLGTSHEQSLVTVFVTPTGKKYHREGCRYLHGGGIEIPLEAARGSYEPCRVCKPPADR